MRRMTPCAALALAAACTATEPPLPPAPDADACGAAALQGLVGQPAAVLETMRFAGPVRIIRPGMAVTLDYSAERLNIGIDASGRITRVVCG